MYYLSLMKKFLIFIGTILMFTTTSLQANVNYLPDFNFELIEGDNLHLSELTGKVVLITNTASKCGFTGQYEGLQSIYDKYGKYGFEVIAIPSNDFLQEYSANSKVKNFCETNFGITFPITSVTKITGKNAHPFYKWIKNEYNFKPRWNFNKILIDKKGNVVDTFGSMVGPNSSKLTRKIELLLKDY